MHLSHHVSSISWSTTDLGERYYFGEWEICRASRWTMLKLKPCLWLRHWWWFERRALSISSSCGLPGGDFEGNKKPLLLIASVCFLDPPNELPRHGQRAEEDEVETQFYSAKTSNFRSLSEEDRSVKCNFPPAPFLCLACFSMDGKESRDFNKLDKSDCGRDGK